MHIPLDLARVFQDRPICVIHHAESNFEANLIQDDFVLGSEGRSLRINCYVRLLAEVELLEALHRINAHNYVAHNRQKGPAQSRNAFLLVEVQLDGFRESVQVE